MPVPWRFLEKTESGASGGEIPERVPDALEDDGTAWPRSIA